MKTTDRKVLTAAFLLTLPALNASAALLDRGNGMIYDSVQNITWLQDGNYAKTSGYNADGLMSWDNATAWAGSLVYGGVSGWRLASANLLSPTDPCYAVDGSCDLGPNNTRSEIGHLFADLGNISSVDATGAPQLGYGFVNTGPFFNVKKSVYWEGEQYAPLANSAWDFDTFFGNQTSDVTSNVQYAWAVHAGDIAAVPVPAAAWLFGSALIGLAGAVRRKDKAA